jgi:hypothetical protein
MPNFIVTYNFPDRDGRTDFVASSEQTLSGMGLNQETTNQSTYYGSYEPRPTPRAFVTALFNATNKLYWQVEDEVTVYYPSATDNGRGKRFADIGRHLFKSSGELQRHHIIFSQG